MRSEHEVNTAVEQYSDMVQRLCMIYLKNHTDTEDVFQTVFLKYMLYDGEFQSREHEKAWLIRVTRNACKDFLKSFFRRRTVSLEEVMDCPNTLLPEYREVLEAVLALAPRYREVIYLHYYEGYTAREMADILGKNVNTIYTLLNRSRNKLREILEGENYGK